MMIECDSLFHVPIFSCSNAQLVAVAGPRGVRFSICLKFENCAAFCRMPMVHSDSYFDICAGRKACINTVANDIDLVKKFAW